MSRTRFYLASIIICALGTTTLHADGRWTIEGGAALVAVDGVRSYNVPSRKLARNDRKQAPAEFVRVGWAPDDRWSFGAAYTQYGELRGSGYSPTPDIFDQFQASVQVIVPLEIRDRIQEFSWDGTYAWRVAPRFVVKGGPVVSYFHSKAELNTLLYSVSVIGSPATVQVARSRIADYEGNDLRLGAMLGVEFAASAQWSLGLSYRYANPPSRTLHIGAVALARHF